MSADHSCIIIVPVGQSHDDLEIVFFAWGKSSLGWMFTAQLSADGSAPATHKACNDQVDNTMAAKYAALPTDGGTLPADLVDVDWSEHGITLQRARDACAATRVWVRTGDGAATTNFAAAKAELGLMDVVE